jgi:hypothetical protein
MLKLLSGKKVFLLLVNDYSRLKWVAQLRSKDEAAEAVKCLRAGAESDSGKKMGCLRRAMSSPPTTSTTTHCTVLVTAERRIGAPQPVRHGNGVQHAQSKRLAGLLLGRSYCQCSLSAQQITDESCRRNDSLRSVLWEEARMAHRRTFGCLVHVENTKLGPMAYPAYDPCTGHILVTQDVVFDELA